MCTRSESAFVAYAMVFRLIHRCCTMPLLYINVCMYSPRISFPYHWIIIYTIYMFGLLWVRMHTWGWKTLNWLIVIPFQTDSSWPFNSVGCVCAYGFGLRFVFCFSFLDFFSNIQILLWNSVTMWRNSAVANSALLEYL